MERLEKVAEWEGLDPLVVTAGFGEGEKWKGAKGCGWPLKSENCLEPIAKNGNLS